MPSGHLDVDAKVGAYTGCVGKADALEGYDDETPSDIV